LLGAGIEVAAPVTRRSNVRGGFNAFSYSRGFSKDGISYAGQLSFRSVEVHYDWFPLPLGFHLSPGLLAYNGNHVNANASVPGGQQFTLGGVTFTSALADPVSGTAKLDFNNVAPTFLLGWGNPIPRSHRRLSVNFELGVAYQGPPNVSLNLKGSACDSSGLFCRSVGSDATIQSDIQAEQKRITHNLSLLRFYPLISLGFSYKF
jgi:hypothetical protein